MYKFSKLGMAAAIALPFALAGVAQAASDGALDGTASVGQSAVSIEKTKAVKVSGLGDIAFGSQASATTDLQQVGNACVFASDGSYSVTVTSDDGANFLLSGTTDTANKLAYSVDWGATALTYGTPLAAQAGDSAAEDCGGTPNATYTVTIAAADFSAAAADSYNGTLTITVAPE